MTFSKKKIIALVALLVIVIIASILLQPKAKKNNSTTVNRTGPNTPLQGQSLAGTTPADDVLAVVTKYVQAHENSVGVDRPNPNAWLDDVQPLTTADYFKLLQPDPNATTGQTPAEYNIAHNNNYIVKSSLSNCIWMSQPTPPTDTLGYVTCTLTESTVDKTNNTVVDGANLPFGWTHSGSQTSPTLKLVKQNGKWLVDNDFTGQNT